MSFSVHVASVGRRSEVGAPAGESSARETTSEAARGTIDPGNAALAIDVRGVSKSYRIYNKPADRLKQAFSWGRKQYFHDFWALHDVSFDVRRGEAIGIVGRNGSGKSTLLQIIAGTLTPTGGEIAVNGRVSALLELGSGFSPEFTGRENVYMNGAILGLSRREIDERFDAIAAFADIGEFLEQPVKTYSSGMMMRLAFSVATCAEPDILIVDEALSVGDILFQHRCMDRIRKLCDGGTTLLFVSHAPDALRALCQRAVWLEQGKLRMLGAARDVADEYMCSFHVQRNATVVHAERTAAPALDDFFTPLDAAAQTLDGGDVIEVQRVRILNARDEPTEHVPIEERFSLEVVLRPKRDLTHISVGFVIKNEHGVELTGESVFNSLRRSLALKAGESRTIRFSAVNNLRGGHYSVAIRVHHVSRWDRADAILLYSDDVAVAFLVSQNPGEPMWFQYRHPFEVSIS